MAALTSLSAPALTTVGSITISNLAALTTFTLGAPGTLKALNGNFTATGCALNAASVNAILASLVAMNGTNGTILYNRAANGVNLSGGTSAAPTGQGITDKATLNARTAGMCITN